MVNMVNLNKIVVLYVQKHSAVTWSTGFKDVFEWESVIVLKRWAVMEKLLYDCCTIMNMQLN